MNSNQNFKLYTVDNIDCGFVFNLIVFVLKEFEKLVQEILASRSVQAGSRKSEVEEVHLRCIKCDHVFTSRSAAVKLRSVSSTALNQVKGSRNIHNRINL